MYRVMNKAYRCTAYETGAGVLHETCMFVPVSDTLNAPERQHVLCRPVDGRPPPK